MKKILLSLALLAVGASVNAAEVDIFKINGQYAGFSSGNVNAGVSVDGTGITQTAYLFYYVREDTGYQYWSGAIPADAVTVNGVASMSVNIDTCTVDVNPTPSCGEVAFTVETNEPASGWVNNGVWGYEYGDFIVRYAGAWQVRSSTASGNVLGYDIYSENVYMGAVDDVTVEVQVGN